MSDTEASTLIPRLPVDEERHTFHDWDIVYQRSHILHSMCTNENRCVAGQPDCCELCFYESTLSLPHLPEMVFPKNRLRLRHRRTGAQLEFNALDALRSVTRDAGGAPVPQVSCAEEWQESRPQAQLEVQKQQQQQTAAAKAQNGAQAEEQQQQQEVANGAKGGEVGEGGGGGGGKVRPYDWTFSTDYQGTLSGGCRLEATEAQLNIAKLKRQEHIEFYHDLTLYEDELHDHGIAECSVKIRVMPSGFFILLRYFLRIDHVMVRINDTRLHYELGNDYILKAFSSKEAKCEQLRHVPPPLFTVPAEIEKHLPVVRRSTEKLFFGGDGGKAEAEAEAEAEGVQQKVQGLKVA